MVKVMILSFSYMRGLPEDETGHGGGFVFDCRCLPNPFWNEELRRFSGKDEPVREFFAKHREEVEAFAGAAEALVRQTIRVFQSDGRQHLMVAFGCTGGQHRSVFFAQRVGEMIHENYPMVNVEINHLAQHISHVYEAR